jgi:hypothetical protein
MRGVGLPVHGSADTPFVVTAPSSAGSKYFPLSLAAKVPAAVATGFFHSTPQIFTLKLSRIKSRYHPKSNQQPKLFTTTIINAAPI